MVKQDTNLHIIGVGASAGGLDALARLLSALTVGDNNTYVIAQHMARDSRIDLVLRLLQRHSSLPVVEAQGNDLLVADKVYLIPPGVCGIVNRGRIQLIAISDEQISSPSVNALFNSIAQEARTGATGIILSGAGSDGLSGCRALKAYGARVIVQRPESAQYDGMPTAIIAAGLGDHVLTPEQIPSVLGKITTPKKKNVASPSPINIDLTAQDNAPFKQLIQNITLATGNDFSQYKDETLRRRLNRRMSMLKIATIADYVTYLQKQPEELHKLQHQFLISLSSFFRDKESFSALKIHLGKWVANKVHGDSIRIWVPGCASGEECYSWAILLLQALGNRQPDFTISVTGSDLNPEAIAIAERGVYPLAALGDFVFENIEDYIDVQGQHFSVKPHVRQLCRFRVENILDNHPSEVDAISCRNLLIYLTSELQDNLIRTFHHILAPDGLLFLGQSETIGLVGITLFSPLDHYHRLYRCKKIAGQLLMEKN